jgi:hypothetical protein
VEHHCASNPPNHHQSPPIAIEVLQTSAADFQRFGIEEQYKAAHGGHADCGFLGEAAE